MDTYLINPRKVFDQVYLPLPKRRCLRPGNTIEVLVHRGEIDRNNPDHLENIYSHYLTMAAVLDEDKYLCAELVSVDNENVCRTYVVHGEYVKSVFREWEYSTIEEQGRALHLPTGIEVQWRPGDSPQSRIVNTIVSEPDVMTPRVAQHCDSEDIPKAIHSIARECIQVKEMLAHAWNIHTKPKHRKV